MTTLRKPHCARLSFQRVLIFSRIYAEPKPPHFFPAASRLTGGEGGFLQHPSSTSTLFPTQPSIGWFLPPSNPYRTASVPPPNSLFPVSHRRLSPALRRSRSPPLLRSETHALTSKTVPPFCFLDQSINHSSFALFISRCLSFNHFSSSLFLFPHF